MPSATPASPPPSESITASARNWRRMSFFCAPSARRMPISRVRSMTETSMMLAMTMPPTTSEMPEMKITSAKAPAEIWRQTASTAPAEIRPNGSSAPNGGVAAGAHDAAHLVLGLLERGHAVGRAHEESEASARTELLAEGAERHVDLLVLVASEHRALLAHQPDDLERAAFDPDQAAERVELAEELAADVGADHHHRRGVIDLGLDEEASGLEVEIAEHRHVGGRPVDLDVLELLAFALHRLVGARRDSDSAAARAQTLDGAGVVDVDPLALQRLEETPPGW